MTTSAERSVEPVASVASESSEEPVASVEPVASEEPVPSVESAAPVAAGRALDWRVLFATAVVLVLWASAFIAIRGIGDALSPGALALGRQLVGALALIAVAIWRRPAMPRGRGLVLVIAYGVLWFAGYTLALNVAERHLDAGTTAMLVNIAPLLVALVAGIVLNEGFPRPLIVGIGIAFAGVVVIALGGTGAHGDATGIALGLVAAALYASGVLVQKVALRTTDALAATWLGCAVGAVALLPFLPQLVGEVGQAPPGALAATVYLGIFPTAIAFLLWAWVLQRSTAGATASATLAVPAIVVLLSWLLLGELPTAAGLIGGALCLAGVAWSRRRSRVRRDQGAPDAATAGSGSAASDRR
ncbi:DMT family transporter [Agromyces larvae]|uniref:DMT family transporter n=1 Tax=Agromyces larvae TaxID=2929802 RepID=A0ABY4C604_9MICO|nr:DMT family transporter [Agromyces larvae]UOE45521.1 DMT family transporter [Agromyces larvae]